MRKKNLIGTVVVMLVLALTGCSDEITSSGNSNSGGKGKPVIEPVDNFITNAAYSTNVRIKPYRSYTFNSGNTPYTNFTSVDINRIFEFDVDKPIAECQDIAVYSTSQGKKYSIGCHASNLNANEIVIENLGPEFVELQVVLTGTRVKKVYEFDSE